MFIINDPVLCFYGPSKMSLSAIVWNYLKYSHSSPWEIYFLCNSATFSKSAQLFLRAIFLQILLKFAGSVKKFQSNSGLGMLTSGQGYWKRIRIARRGQILWLCQRLNVKPIPHNQMHGKRLKKLKSCEMVKDEGWMMNDERWMMMMKDSSCLGVLVTDRLTYGRTIVNVDWK